MSLLKVELVTPEGKLFDGRAVFVSLPGTEGGFGVYYEHAPLVSSLSNGSIQIGLPNETKNFIIDGGVVEVFNNQVSILVENIL